MACVVVFEVDSPRHPVGGSRVAEQPFRSASVAHLIGRKIYYNNINIKKIIKKRGKKSH